MTSKVTFKIVREVEVSVAWDQDDIKGTRVCFVDHEKIARVSFLLLGKSVDVFYREFRWYSNYGLEDKVKIEVQEPIRLEIFEQGLDAHERCEKRLCEQVGRLIRNEQAYPRGGCKLF